ncbi:MAG TPA: N-acetyltransferase [Verrucomicrobiota bacterium]|nr:N-acetyltransferase [Verrucomicrobiales bacterium]HRI16784.1 N-acetyltransferase [Verrucomicrobiota bacterium]
MPDPFVVTPLDHRQVADRRRFIRVAYDVYRHDRNWVAPLESELQGVLRPENPFYQHAHIQLWVVSQGGRDLGRIAAIEDAAHNQLHRERTAFFGFFECRREPAAAAALFAAATDWARARGLDRLRGPMNPSINDECGLLIEGFQSPPVLMMTYNPDYYVGLVEAAGFQKVKDLLAFRVAVSEAPAERLNRLRARFLARNPELSLRPVTFKTLTTDVPLIKQVYNEAWERNWGAVPLSDLEIDFLVERLKPLLREGLVWLTERRGQAVGFLLALPDFNVALQPLRGRLCSLGLLRAAPYVLGWRQPAGMRLVALGVRQEYRGRGIEAAMLAETLTASRRLGFAECEAGWVLEDNTAVRRVIAVFGGRPYKTYRLYERMH